MSHSKKEKICAANRCGKLQPQKKKKNLQENRRSLEYERQEEKVPHGQCKHGTG